MQVVSKINGDTGAAGARGRTEDVTSGTGLTWIPPRDERRRNERTNEQTHEQVNELGDIEFSVWGGGPKKLAQRD